MPKATYINLETINKDGSVPESRLNDPLSVQAIVQEMIRADEKRNKTDATVAGLFDGNPPYRPSVLREQAQAWRSNTNFRIAEAFLNVALTSYWDLVTEPQQKVQIRTAIGNEDQREDWSSIITEEFEALNDDDSKLNYMFRLSQHDMVLFRCGPVMYDDTYGIRARPVKQAKLLAEDGSPSNVDDWVLAVVLVDYKADELYKFIRNPDVAKRIGYDVGAVRKALLHYAPESMFKKQATRGRDWLFYEERVRNNDLYISRISEDIPVAHVFYREFPKEGQECGRISHCMVINDNDPAEFLFRSVGRFEKWQNVIHPFYYDTGNGSHHSVKGLGIKAYGALELYNRLENHLVDAGFWGSAIHMQARDMASLQNLAVTAMGPYILHQPGTDLMQVNIGAQMDGPIAVKEDVKNTLIANLAQYRQDANRRRQGSEPPTARQVNYEAENENVITKSGMTWYCEQLDAFWSERYRRCANPNIQAMNDGGKLALDFQKRCRDRRVPIEALLKVEHVRATRTIGMGSSDARMQAMMRMLQRLPLYDEAGRRRILEDITSADVGHSQMRRYVSKSQDSPYTSDQRAEARQWVGTMKVGVTPEITPSQNAVIYASVWLQAANDAVGSLEQGGNPAEVYSFLEVIGPAIRNQLNRFAGDESRKDLYEALDAQWGKLSAVHDKIGAQLQKQAREQAKLQQRQQQVMSDEQLNQFQVASKVQLSREKQQANMKLKQEVHDQRLVHDAQSARQDAAIKDVTTASEIRNNRLKTAATTKAPKSEK